MKKITLAVVAMLGWSQLSIGAPANIPRFIFTKPSVCYSIDGLPKEIEVASLKIVPEKRLLTKLDEVVGINGALKFAGKTYPVSGSCVFVKYDSWGDQTMPFGAACHLQGAVGVMHSENAVGLIGVSMAMNLDYGTGPYKLAMAISKSDEAGAVQVQKYYPSMTMRPCLNF